MSYPDGTLSSRIPGAKEKDCKENTENMENNLDQESLGKSLAPTPPTNLSSHIPNGGLVAWMQCIGAFFLFFNCWGIVNTFGVYQTFYEQVLLPHESSSNISWIGSLQAFLLVFGGCVTGPLFDYGYLRALIFAGSFLVVFGMMMTSICTQYWQLVLAQGLVVGLGSGSFFLCSVAVLPMYFTTKRALVLGIAASGSSLGGVIYPIVFRQLQPRIGFGWATRVIAFIILGTLIVPLTVMKMPVKPSTHRKIFDPTAWRETPYVILAIGMFVGFMGLYIPFFYVQTYSIEKNIMTEDLAFYLLPILNTGSLFGRLIPNIIADKHGPLNILIPCTFFSALLAFAWIGIKSTAGIVPFCLLYGFFSGSFVSLLPSVTVNLSPSLGVVGVRLGMLFVPTALGLLIGNPIAGAILRKGWQPLEAFCGALIALSMCALIAVKITKYGWTIKAKA